MNLTRLLLLILAVSLITCTRKNVTTDNAANRPITIGAVGKLHGYLYKIKCGDPQDSRSCKISSEDERSSFQVVLEGDSTVTYNLTLHIRGLVEPRRYAGGELYDSTNKWFCAGGVPDSSRANNGQAYNIYKISVSKPRQDYYLNCDTENYLGGGYMPSHTIYKLDYSVTIPVRGGATISVITDDEAGSGMINNADAQTVEDIPADVLGQPWDGQFFYIEADSISPADQPAS